MQVVPTFMLVWLLAFDRLTDVRTITYVSIHRVYHVYRDRAHQRIRGKTGVVDVQSKYDVIKIGQL